MVLRVTAVALSALSATPAVSSDSTPYSHGPLSSKHALPIDSSPSRKAESQQTSPSSLGESSPVNPFKDDPRKLQAVGGPVTDVSSCRPAPSWRGCQPMSQWLVHNGDTLVSGWRVMELQFFSDRTCTNRLAVAEPLSGGFLACDGGASGFQPAAALDGRPQTLWASSCGTENRDCDGVPSTPSDPFRDRCEAFDTRFRTDPATGAKTYHGTYVGATFSSPQAVQCVRILQAGAPYRASRVTVTSHNELDCIVCGHNAIHLETLVVDGYNTYIGTPGLYGEFFTAIDRWVTSSGTPMSTRGVWPPWPLGWENDVAAGFLNVTTDSPQINFPLSIEPFKKGFPPPSIHYLARWQGLIRIIRGGLYRMSLACDTEAILYLNEQLTLMNNGTTRVGLYYREEQSMMLSAGVIYIELQYKHIYDAVSNDRNGFVLEYRGPDTDNNWQPMMSAATGTTTPPPQAGSWRVVPQETFLRGITNDRQVSTAVYLIEENKHCHDVRYRIFGDRPSAQAACDADPMCGGIYGRDCNVQKDSYMGLFLCALANPAAHLVLGNSTENSCVWVRYDQSDITTIAPTTTAPASGSIARSGFPAAVVLVGTAAILLGW